MTKLINSLFSIFIIIIIVFSACNEKPIEKIDSLLCDAEKRTKNEQFFLAQKNSVAKFSFGTSQSNEMAFSGKFSSKVTEISPYGMSYTLENVQTNDYYHISVWRHSAEGNGALVVADATAKKLYKTQTSPNISKESGWELLEIDLFIPPNLSNENINIYVWCQDADSAFFDDLKIEKRYKKNYPEFRGDVLQLFIDSVDVDEMNLARKKSYEIGVVVDDDWTNCILFYGNEMIKAKIRFYGDSLNHLEDEKWSFHVKILKGKAWNGMSEFVLKSPKHHHFIDEWLARQVFRNEGVACYEYGFSPIVINNRNMGIFAFEGMPKRNFYTANKRLKTIVLGFEQSAVRQAMQFEHRNISRPRLPYFLKAQVVASEKIKTISTFNWFSIATNKLEKFKAGDTNPEQNFDIELFAKYYALLDLFGNVNSSDWRQSRFYYNPLTMKLEPVLMHCNSQVGADEISEFCLIGDFSNKSVSSSANFALATLFADKKFAALYIFYLNKYSSQGFVNKILTNFSVSVNVFEKQLAKEFPYYKFDSENFRDKANLIKNQTDKLRTKIDEENYFDKLRQNLNDAKFKYSRSKDFSLLPFMVNANFLEKQEGENRIAIKNYYPTDIEVVGSGVSENKPEQNFADPIDIQAFVIGSGNMIITLPSEHKYLYIRFKNSNRLSGVKISLLSSVPANISSADSYKFVTDNSANISVLDDSVVFRSAIHYIDSVIFFDTKRVVVFEAGAKVVFSENAGIISHSAVFCRGTKTENVSFTSSGKQCLGLLVVASENKSVFENTVFSDFRGGAKFCQIEPTAIATFYKTQVELKGCRFEDIRAKNAVEIFDSKYEITNTKFEDIRKSALKIEYSSGYCFDLRFDKIKQYAINSKWSAVDISETQFEEIGKIAVRAQKKSKVTVFDSYFIDSRFALVSIDESNIWASDIKLIDCDYGLVAYQRSNAYHSSSLTVNKLEYENIYRLHLLENESVLFLEGREIRTNRKNITLKELRK